MQNARNLVNGNDTKHEKLTQKDRLLIKSVNARQSFWPCDKKGENGTFCDNRNDRRKTQQEKTPRKDVG